MGRYLVVIPERSNRLYLVPCRNVDRITMLLLRTVMCGPKAVARMKQSFTGVRRSQHRHGLLCKLVGSDTSALRTTHHPANRLLFLAGAYFQYPTSCGQNATITRLKFHGLHDQRPTFFPRSQIPYIPSTFSSTLTTRPPSMRCELATL